MNQRNSQRVPVLPNLSTALRWCREAGVSHSWGGKEPPAHSFPRAVADLHHPSRPLDRVRSIVIHRSGFACGNAAMLRWYHRMINGWTDIGYHFVVGNGVGDWSLEGGIEQGRPLDLAGAHVQGHNGDTWAICLVDNTDHFRSKPPSQLQELATVNLLTHLILRGGDDVRILGHSDLAQARCPGRAVPVSHFEHLARSRAKLTPCRIRREVTLDLRRAFSQKQLDYRAPDRCLPELKKVGVTRLAFPFHWRRFPWEDLDLAKLWVSVAHDHGIGVVLYTGPFGTERPDFIKEGEGRRGWLQKDSRGNPIPYPGSGGTMFMCDPLSPYLEEYRLPIILRFLEATAADGVFFDIPWFLKGADTGILSEDQHSPEDSGCVPMNRKERSIRQALGNAALTLRRQFPALWICANCGAFPMWDVCTQGGGPHSLNGWFDELITEWTPASSQEVDSVSQVITTARVLAPGCRISHAWNPRRTRVGSELESALQKADAGRWWVELP